MHRVVAFAPDDYETVRAVRGERRAPRRTTVTAGRLDGLAAELATVDRRVDSLREVLRLPERDPPARVEARLDQSTLRALRTDCRAHAEVLRAERAVDPLLERWAADAQQWFTPAERRLAGGYETLRTLADVADVAIDAGATVRIHD
ncbi:hypothetical protein N0B31_12805 [Salinirubellus salinus]|uniref:Uncharacterized protein n=1 Tax=Salinirubellus salinus TaxID=1364945 RepID=A0A9E7U987_9EURY|nr:hypothetical protein [Salinirubellus salinus]UWM53028.1 hypothetical protein N0B31_12805 [Salinirubellus salinus]